MPAESEIIASMEAKGLRWIATLAKPLHGTSYPHETPRELYKRQRRNVVIVEFHYSTAVYVFEQTVTERVTDWHEWFAASVPAEKAVAA